MGNQTDREHRLAGYHFDSDTGEHEARCSCGWVSPPFTDPNVAGAIWDSHIAGGGAGLSSPCTAGR